MSKSAILLIRSKDIRLPDGCRFYFEDEEDYVSFEPFFEIVAPCSVSAAGHGRYYAPGYERGHWPSIAACLMEFFALNPGADIWYIDDESIPHDLANLNARKPFSQEDLLAYTAHYIKRGNRP